MYIFRDTEYVKLYRERNSNIYRYYAPPVMQQPDDNKVNVPEEDMEVSEANVPMQPPDDANAQNNSSNSDQVYI